MVSRTAFGSITQKLERDGSFGWKPLNHAVPLPSPHTQMVAVRFIAKGGGECVVGRGEG